MSRSRAGGTPAWVSSMDAWLWSRAARSASARASSRPSRARALGSRSPTSTPTAAGRLAARSLGRRPRGGDRRRRVECGGRRADGRRGGRRPRAPGHPRQQRRASSRSTGISASRTRPRRSGIGSWASISRARSSCRSTRCPRIRAPGRRRGRQHGQRAGAPVDAAGAVVCGEQGRRAVADPEHGARLRARGHPRERDLPRHHRFGDGADRGPGRGRRHRGEPAPLRRVPSDRSARCAGRHREAVLFLASDRASFITGEHLASTAASWPRARGRRARAPRSERAGAADPILPLTELRRHVGDLSQLVSVRTVRLTDGNEDGVRAVDVRVTRRAVGARAPRPGDGPRPGLGRRAAGQLAEHDRDRRARPTSTRRTGCAASTAGCS